MLEEQQNLELIGLEDDNENDDEEDLDYDDDNVFGIGNGEYEMIAPTGFNTTDLDKRIADLEKYYQVKNIFCEVWFLPQCHSEQFNHLVSRENNNYVPNFLSLFNRRLYQVLGSLN